MKQCVFELNKIVNYVRNFEKDIFQGKISYQKFHKIVVLSLLFDFFENILFLKNKTDKDFIIKEKYYKTSLETFKNSELSEQGIINLILEIIEQEYYPRNVNSASNIIYREEGFSNIYDFKKFANNKNYIRTCYNENL